MTSGQRLDSTRGKGGGTDTYRDKDHKPKVTLVSVFEGGAPSLRSPKKSSKESGSYVTARLITIL